MRIIGPEPRGANLARRPVAPQPADQLLQLAYQVERLGWDRATPEQALAAKLGIRDELRRIAREIGR